MYTIKDRVSYSRVGRDGRLGVAELVNALQDCALFHSEDIGHSAATLAERHRAWLVSAWHVVIERRPDMAEEFLVHTWAYKMTNLFGHRNFLMETDDHEVLAYADSRWFFFDSEEMVPAKVDDAEKEAYPIEPAYDMDYSSRKVAAPKELENAGEIYVNPSYLDTNDHMNNGQYVRLSCCYLPEDFEVREFRAEFRKAVHFGQTIQVKTGTDINRFYVVFTDENEEPYYISEFLTGSE